MKNSVPNRPQNSSSTMVPAPVKAQEFLSPLAAFFVALALIVTVFAIYSPALNFQFILDDHRFSGDPRLQSSGHVWEYFTSFVWSQIPGGPISFYRPIFLLWLRLNFIFGDASPWAWHLLSVAKHISVAVLLGLLAWKLLRDRVAALLAATLFALHPAQTESVAWITVPDPLMSAAVLGVLLLYLKCAERISAASEPLAGKANRKARKQARAHSKEKQDDSLMWLVASAAVCLIALMAKETAVVLPVLIFCLALLLPSKKPAPKEPAPEQSTGHAARLFSAFRQTLPFLAVTVVYFLLRLSALGGQISPRTQNLPWKTVILSWPAILLFYVKALFWPVRSRAFADPALSDTFSFRGVLLPALGVLFVAAILAGFCLWAKKAARRELPDRQAANVECALLLGTLLLVLPILLALNLNSLNPGDFLHGRYTYLPLAGLMLLLATGWHLVKKGRSVLLAGAGLIAIAFSVLSVKQETMWKDDLTVFTVAHELAPHNVPVAESLSRAHVQAALGLLDEPSGCDAAMPIFENAIQKFPQDWYAWAGEGECYVKLDNLPEAEQSLRRAYELSHLPRVGEEWQLLREKMGLPSTPLN